MKDDEKSSRYWFKRRRYGLGWTPVTIEGWSVVVAFFVVVICGLFVLRGAPRSVVSRQLVMYLGIVVVSTVLLFGVASLKGPRPKWRWGSKPDDNPDEDF